MKKVLLSLAAVGTAMSANAQLLNYGFETSDILPGSVVTENWYSVNAETGEVKYENFQNCQCILPSAGTGIDASNSLWVSTDVTGNTWERVVAFTNTGVAENKSYRISLWVKGEGDFNVALLKGCFNHDLALQGGNGTSYVDQTKTFTAANNDDFVRYSYVVWSPSRDVMKAKKADFEKDEFWNQDFLRLAFTGIGNYSVDNVKIEESAVQGVVCNGTVVRVDFGYATNGADLAAAAGGTLVLDPSCVSVKIDGEAAGIESVEIKSDGQFYIFLDENSYIDQSSAVSVSFTNPGDLKYSTNVAPESFDNPNAAVYNFTDEQGYFDESLFATSMAWEEAALVTSDPENDSFEIDNDINQFSFTFNKAVWSESENNGKPTATLAGPGVSEELEVVAFEGCQPTLTFKRAEGAAALANGTYTISVDNVCNEKDVATTTPFVVTFEVGKVAVGTFVYTDYSSVWMEGEYNTAQPTNGWISYFNGEENSSNANRVGNFITDEKGVGFYFCQRDGSVAAKLTLGEKEEAPFTLPAGNVQITFFSTKWQGAGGTYSYKLVKKDNPEEVVASGDIASEGNIANFGEAATSIPGAAVKIPDMAAGDYILTLETAAGWSGTIFFGVDVKTYVVDGDPGTPVVLIDENFASVENGKVPAAGTGWAVYDNNNLGAKGQSQSGRNRMMATGTCSNLSIGFYNRCLGGDPTTYYMTYGEPAPEGQEVEEPKFMLENAKYSFSWYAVNWKGDEQTYYFQLINAETNEVEYEMTPVKVKANVNGGQQTADAVQIQFNYAPQGGQYIMKWWMTGESIIGKIRVEKMASLAVFWKNKLINDGLDIAKAERENANADEYAGTTRDNLDAVIAKNTNPTDYHTPKAYQAGIDECLAAAKAMSARREAIAKFKTDIEKLAAALADIDAKYDQLEIIPEYKELVAKYAEVNPSTLEDEELLPVQAKITAGVSAVKNVVDAVNNLITKQIQNLLAAISVYGEELSDEFSLAWISEGEQALTDNQEVAGQLQKILTACIYDSIANGYNFSYFDEEAQTSFPDSIDITGYIANNMFYTVNPQKNYEASAANAAFPGWNITEGTVSNVWWWENPLAINAGNPAVNASLRNTGSNAFKVDQVLNNLPVGVYTMFMKTADCSNVADVSTSYTKKDESLPWSTSEVYAKIGETVTSVEANYGAGQVWRNASDTYLPNIQGTVAAGENTVAMTIGANMNCTSDAAQVDDTRLFMTGKIEGFDYRAAADALLASIPSSLKAVERTDAPVAVEFFNLAGQKGAAQGVNIKVERFSDGYTVVKKVIVK